jgi:hypothetical protein
MKGIQLMLQKVRHEIIDIRHKISQTPQSTNQLINQSTNHTINYSTNQPTPTTPASPSTPNIY